MQTRRLERRAIEIIVLACLALIAVYAIRAATEPTTVIALELGVIAPMALVSLFRPRLGAWILGALPLIAGCVNRLTGVPAAVEMMAVSTAGTASLALAIGATSNRVASMSLVLSGFVVLFATSINDDPRGIAVAIVWISVCMWHLIANHWERLSICMAESIEPSRGVRPVSLIVALSVCLISGAIARNRWTESSRLASGFMPTSGGTKWSDPSARDGVGTGDAAIAAREHAESFGAVDSDVFLESTESTLFDMISESLGEPKLKNKFERRQGFDSDKFIPSHQQLTQTEKGGQSFSTSRAAIKKNLSLRNSSSTSVIQWIGPTGIRLAMHRFDRFDGVTWTSSEQSSSDRPRRRQIGDESWFFLPSLLERWTNETAPQLGTVKVLRLESTRIPSPMATTGVHIKDIDRVDFFAWDQHGNLFMPGRERVPSLTTIDLASVRISEDELVRGLSSVAPADSTQIDPELARYAKHVTDGIRHPYDQLQAILRHLRTDFVFDRDHSVDSENPVQAFLRTRRGGDHLFATTAAQFARQLGFESRLVTGFYVRPESWDLAAGHAEIESSDVHVWAEIKLNDDLWFEVEPTPGYAPPVYTPSLWLLAKRWAAEAWPAIVAMTIASIVLFLTRSVWADWILRLLWFFSALFGPRTRLQFAMWILATRARLAGKSRPVHDPQRDWLTQLAAPHLELSQLVRRVCDSADRLCWHRAGQAELATADVSDLLRQMNAQFFKRQANKVSA